MLSPTALFWTQIIAAIGWLIVSLQVYGLWKALCDGSARRAWSIVQGRITASQAGGSPTHPVHGDVGDTGIVIRYRYRVGDKDYEGDGARIGGKSRTMGLLAKALLKQYPQGREVDVYYDPADPATSSLEEKGKNTLPTLLVFLVVFASITGILTAHAVAGKMIMMSNGLPFFTLILPTAALLVGAGAIAAYVVDRRNRAAAASWPSTEGQIVVSKVVEEQEPEEREDSDGRTEESVDTFYRPEIRFTYRVGDRDYSAETWKPGAVVSHGTPGPAEKVVARYAAGQKVSVYYDPRRPDTAVLEPSNREGAGMVLAVGIVFGLAGTLFMWLMTHGQWVNAATGS
jgi:hypothetical protein